MPTTSGNCIPFGMNLMVECETFQEIKPSKIKVTIPLPLGIFVRKKCKPKSYNWKKNNEGKGVMDVFYKLYVNYVRNQCSGLIVGSN